ncbi:MAG: hypothetical protein AB7I25_07880 [Vicinamibacterales bacterium]
MKTLMRVAIAVTALGAAMVGTGLAHDGHTHTVMGVVWKAGAEQIEVKTKDGKTETILITDKTAVSRGKTAADLSDVVPGARVVVDVGTGKKPLTARSIKVGVVEPGAKQKRS